MAEVVDEDDPWAPWTPEYVAERLSGVGTLWYVVAGWAVDLFLGAQTREHEDLEIGVPVAGFPDIRTRLSELDFYVVGDGFRHPLSSAAFDEHFQTWGWSTTAGAYVIDVFRDPHDADTWICRRDETLRREYTDVVLFTDSGIPYLSPEIVMLFKAKHMRSKDERDWDRVRPMLDGRQRAWLRSALDVVHPGHPWRMQLS